MDKEKVEELIQHARTVSYDTRTIAFFIGVGTIFMLIGIAWIVDIMNEQSELLQQLIEAQK